MLGFEKCALPDRLTQSKGLVKPPDNSFLDLSPTLRRTSALVTE